jgi:hypothetical protein
MGMTLVPLCRTVAEVVEKRTGEMGTGLVCFGEVSLTPRLSPVTT